MKVLKNRRKRASKGKRVAVSDAVWTRMEQRRERYAKKPSWDHMLRRMLGLPDRNGTTRALIEGFLEVNSGMFYLKESEARGASVVAAAKAKTKRVKQPIFMREVV